MSTRILIKGKLFSVDPNALQSFSDDLREQYHNQIVISRPMVSNEGDYYILITFYGETDYEMQKVR